MSNERAATALTYVDLLFLKDRIERWIRFGKPVSEVENDRRRRTVAFAPGSIFCFVRWRAGEHGTVQSRIAVLRAFTPGKPFTIYPEVSPGAEILLNIAGWSKVQRVLEAIDGVERGGFSPEAVAPDYWRHVGARIDVGLPPHVYDRARHRAWLVRRRLFA